MFYAPIGEHVLGLQLRGALCPNVTTAVSVQAIAGTPHRYRTGSNNSQPSIVPSPD